MKNFALFFSLASLVGMFWACSSETEPVKVDNPSSEVPTSSESKSSAVQSSSASKPVDNPASSGEVKSDTITNEVYISSGNEYNDPYFSSGIFCWTKECEDTWTSSSSGSSSSISIEVTMSSEAVVEPMISENKMIDMRDNKEYPLVRIGSTHWMAKNIDYQGKKGIYCETPEGKNVCEKYGTFYTYAAAQSVCPTGWRLPNKAEVDAALETKGLEFWEIGGRFKYASGVEYGDEGKHGFLWISSDSNNNIMFKHYSEDDLETEYTNASERAYNVRCVAEN